MSIPLVLAGLVLGGVVLNVRIACGMFRVAATYRASSFMVDSTAAVLLMCLVNVNRSTISTQLQVHLLTIMAKYTQMFAIIKTTS